MLPVKSVLIANGKIAALDPAEQNANKRARRRRWRCDAGAGGWARASDVRRMDAGAGLNRLDRQLSPRRHHQHDLGWGTACSRHRLRESHAGARDIARHRHRSYDWPGALERRQAIRGYGFDGSRHDRGAFRSSRRMPASNGSSSLFYPFKDDTSEARNYVRWAHARGMRVKVHTGGVSRSGASVVCGYSILSWLQPDIAAHVAAARSPCPTKISTPWSTIPPS